MRFALRRLPMEHEKGVRNGHFLALRKRLDWRSAALWRCWRKVAELGPLPPDGTVGLSARRVEIVVQGREVLQIQKACRCFTVEPPVQYAAIEATLRRLDITTRVQRVIIAPKRIQVARQERDQKILSRRKLGGDPDQRQFLLNDREGHDVFAYCARQPDAQCFALFGTEPAGLQSARRIGRPDRQARPVTENRP
jgi:hypothetical protein